MGADRLDHAFFAHECRPRLGSLLHEKGLLTEEQLDEALRERDERGGGLLGEILVSLGFIFEDELARVLAEQAGLSFADVDTISVDRHAATTLPRELGETLCVLPVRFSSDGGVVVAVADPLDSAVLPQLELALNGPIELTVATASSIRRAWRSFGPTHQ
jgi:type IV pilus assembly protein PilB